ncbi:efflux RND transporter periplasmic adaptor subunit [Alsobacter sp. SYSU M60028]|uniref:Efflux RND transporter periplasmic adaptor subunit n=1 Tax=Alsobacter ponti TaxID=2962936 RepID=A0ABT1LFV2_9HYPH|nr:efflux RND transporter periplasmic adaptor subunit [Alsobacter ponti]MCP8939605.1 efflux RND transporter periplasmic adaptor subunit [Alsobacter ponti]
MARTWRVTIPLVTLVVAGALLTPLFVDTGFGPQRQNRRREAQDPVSVLATPARLADVPVYIDGVGTARPAATVTVRPQVDGLLQKVLFREGQDVKKGDVLAQIDPAIYQAQLDQALAKKAQNEALLENAKRDLERYVRLAETNSVTRQQADTQRSTVAQLEAQLKSDQAAIDSARAYLAYTRIVAPIDGRTGIRALDEGNLVKQSDAAGLVTISQVSPIAVVFSVPQQQLPRITKAWSAGKVPVDAMDADNKAPLESGELQVIDNLVDQTTGTVRLKAEFPNRDMALWPGAFANVRLLVDTLEGVVVVPTAAVQRGPKGAFVYVVKPDSTVTVSPVMVGQQDDVQTVIASGLAADEKVVTTGFARLAEGTPVTVAAPEPLPEPNATPTVSRRQQRQQRQSGQGQRRPDAAQGQPARPADAGPRAEATPAPSAGTVR